MCITASSFIIRLSEGNQACAPLAVLRIFNLITGDVVTEGKLLCKTQCDYKTSGLPCGLRLGHSQVIKSREKSSYCFLVFTDRVDQRDLVPSSIP